MFRRMRYLQRRGGIWWIRRPIPARLWPILGKRELLVSLRTGDLQLAERRALAEFPRIDRELAEAERALTDPALATRFRRRGEKTLSPATVRKLLNALGAVLSTPFVRATSTPRWPRMV